MMKKVILPVVVLFLAAGGIILGILQFLWIDQVSKSEEERIRREMRINLIQAMSNAGDEVRMVVSLFHSPGGAPRSTDRYLTVITHNIEYWNEAALFPGLLAGGYVVSLDENDSTYIFEKEGFSQGPVPEALQPVIEAVKTGNTAENVLSDLLVPLYKDGFVLVSYRGMFRFESDVDKADVDEAGNIQGGPPFLAFCRIDLSVLLEEVLPHYLTLYLRQYPHAVISSEGGTIFASAGFLQQEVRERSPEIAVPIISPLSLGDPRNFLEGDRPASIQKPARTGPGDRSVGDVDRQSPFLAFLLSRSLGHDMMRLLQGGEGPLARVSVYYPNRPLEEIIAVRKSVNLVVSFGIVAVLLLSFLVMYRLYTKTGELRAREQEFVASMSHELRTPVSVIRSAADNLADGVIGDEKRVETYGKLIREQAARLTRMVEGILAFAGLSSGVRSREEKVDIISLSRAVVDSLRPFAEKVGATIGVSIDGVPACVKTDPSALRLIMENLLTNALRHGLRSSTEDERGAGNAVLEYRGDPVRLEVSCTGKGNCTIIVEDHGGGIPAKEAGKLFEPFVRGEQAVKEQREGTGLGLHLVKRVVALLGGTIALESPYRNRLGIMVSGCRFRVEFPVEEVSVNEG